MAQLLFLNLFLLHMYLMISFCLC